VTTNPLLARFLRHISEKLCWFAALLASTEAHDEAQCVVLFPQGVDCLNIVTAGLHQLEQLIEI